MTSAEVDKTSTSLAQAKNTENNFTSKTLSNNTNMSPSSSALGTNYSESTQSFSQNPTISSSNESTHSQHYESQNFYGDNTQGYSYEGTNIPAEYSGTYQTNSVDYAQATYVSFSLNIYLYMKAKNLNSYLPFYTSQEMIITVLNNIIRL